MSWFCVFISKSRVILHITDAPACQSASVQHINMQLEIPLAQKHKSRHKQVPVSLWCSPTLWTVKAPLKLHDGDNEKASLSHYPACVIEQQCICTESFQEAWIREKHSNFNKQLVWIAVHLCSCFHLGSHIHASICGPVMSSMPEMNTGLKIAFNYCLKDILETINVLWHTHTQTHTTCVTLINSPTKCNRTHTIFHTHTHTHSHYQFTISH